MTSNRDDTRQAPDLDADGEDRRAGGGALEALPSVSVILPFLDAEETIEEQLAALREQTYSGAYEVIASDNGSSDGSRRIVQAWAGTWSRLRLVDASGSRGVSHARNRGLAAAAGEVVLGCDADDVVAPDWIEAMVAALVRGEVDVVGGRFDEDKLNPRSVRAWFSMHPETHAPMSFGIAPVAIGANFGTRAAVARSVGGWDTRYVGGGEDIVFSWRAQEHGYRVGFAADAIVYHRRRSSLATLARQSFLRGRQVPRLMQDFRGSSLGRPRFRRGPAKTALSLLALLPRAVIRAEARGRFVRVASTALGVLVARFERLVRPRGVRVRSVAAGATPRPRRRPE